MEPITWYENDELWVSLAPFLFTADRLEGTSIEAEQIVKLLDLKPNDSILDLCCGKGRFSLELAKRGFKVTGVDRTADFLNIASKLALAADVSCEFICDDILKFWRPGKFDAVLNIFHSFGYYENDEDNKKVLRNAYSSLVKGGSLLIDMLSREQILAGQQYFEHQIGEQRLVGSRHFTSNMQRVEDRWTLWSASQQRCFATSARMYSPDELSYLLRESGFSCVAISGGLDGSGYAPDSGRLVTVATK